MFSSKICSQDPLRYALLVAAFFTVMTADGMDMTELDMRSSSKLMLCLLADLTNMPISWQRDHLGPLMSKMVEECPSITRVMQQVISIVLRLEAQQICMLYCGHVAVIKGCSMTHKCCINFA